MGASCTKCTDTVCCCSPCCKKCCPPSPPSRKDKALSPIERIFQRTVGTMTKPQSLPPPPPPPPPPLSPPVLKIAVIEKKKTDVSSLDVIGRDANFDSIVNVELSLNIDMERFAGIEKEKGSNKSKLNPKETQKYPEWNEQYFIHGVLSDIVADVSGKIHGCFSSSMSKDADNLLLMLDEINKIAAVILEERRSKIAVVEKSSIDRFIQNRDELVQVLLKDGCIHANLYEAKYRELLEEFIKLLEIEMSKHLDRLQEQIEEERKSIFQNVNDRIDRITTQADVARNTIHQKLQITVVRKRQEIFKKIEEISLDAATQPLGYEHLRNMKVDIYSTVGKKKEESHCVNMEERKKFTKLIAEAKPQQPAMKRTVYLGSTLPTRQTHRSNP